VVNSNSESKKIRTTTQSQLKESDFKTPDTNPADEKVKPFLKRFKDFFKNTDNPPNIFGAFLEIFHTRG